MGSKYIALLALLFIVNISFAQESIPESIIPSISEAYIDKLVASAKEHYPKAKTFEDRINIAHYNVQKAKLDWFNILNFNYIYAPASSSGTVATTTGLTYSNGAQFGVGASIGTILQKPGLVRVAKQEYDIAKLNQEEYFLNITAIVKQRYYLYVQQLSTLNWKTKTMESADQIAKESKYKFEKGEITFDAYNTTYSAYSTSVQAKMDAEVAYLIAKSNLEEIIGVKLEEIK